MRQNYQNGGMIGGGQNDTNSPTHLNNQAENNAESGEADEGGRDDGHFYRNNNTVDEGTGGAGESYMT